jgi:hypothetical protein
MRRDHGAEGRAVTSVELALPSAKTPAVAQSIPRTVTRHIPRPLRTHRAHSALSFSRPAAFLTLFTAMLDRAGISALLRDTRVQRLLVANTLGSIGSGVTIFSVPWLMVHRAGGNEAYRWITIATTIVLFALMPYYGAWVDRHSRKTALLASEVWGLLATLAMAGVGGGRGQGGGGQGRGV